MPQIKSMPGDALTDRQQAVLDYIRASRRERGMSPTVRDVMVHFGFRSPTAAQQHLRALARKGAIRRDPLLSRSIVVVGEADPLPELLACCRLALASPGAMGPGLRARMARAVGMASEGEVPDA